MEKRKYLIKVYGLETDDMITKYNKEIIVCDDDPQDDEYYKMRLEEDAEDLFSPTKILTKVFRIIEI